MGGWDELELVLRTGIAFALGFMVGLEREQKAKPAGIRTHALVGGSCALITSTGLALAGDQVGEALRVHAGVITGIGFIGGGAVLHKGGDVEGLTTAATVLAAATIGVAAGSGLFILASMGTAMTLLVSYAAIPLKLRVQGTEAVAPAPSDSGDDDVESSGQWRRTVNRASR